MGIYVKFWHFFTIPILQIWLCHVTQEANFEKILFFLNFAFNIGKSCKIASRKALYVRIDQPKTSRGVETPPPPVLLGLTLFSMGAIMAPYSFSLISPERLELTPSNFLTFSFYLLAIRKI